MKTIFVLFDSLNRHMLPPYGGKIHAPNFSRLAARAATFETSYVASMPCMPARRDLLTGRPSFLHRAWGPMEPYDDSLPSLLREAGVYSHLISDHVHYWEEGGANYHTKYDTWEIVRGQEGDPWIPQVKRPERPPAVARRDDKLGEQDYINRQEMPTPEHQPMSRVFAHARKFLERNRAEDNWFLQVETFDPHEPFFTHQRYKDIYPEHYTKYRGADFDWPPYREVRETPEEVEHLRYEYASLVSMCDEKLGELLDQMDEMDLWKDTMLIVATDHGFLLSEHDNWGKCWTPFYEEVARTPFFVWDPRCPSAAGQRRRSLVQPALDLAPTVLQFFGTEPTPRMTGGDLRETIASDQPVREYGIFGMFGSHLNITDGRHVYMRGNPEEQANQPLYEYTLMPVNMRNAFALWRFREPFETRRFNFTKGCHLMRIPADNGMFSEKGPSEKTFQTLLFDLSRDPQQKNPIRNLETEKRFVIALSNLLLQLDAPKEQWERLGLPQAPS